MLRTTLLLLTALGIATATAPSRHPRASASPHRDRHGPAGVPLDPGVLHPYALPRELTMTRGD